ncbi:tRNA (adenine-N(1))-methyltransferase [Bacillaceae bacterium Marseille-Q3522]|nr:tRNA (adenine-N(1))-methyltransferase [Bacillaceae bacterium Marseille-Q3522]
MNIDKLSKRLETLIRYIPFGSRIADIGSDHAYLPCYAVAKGSVLFAIAGEIAEGPYQTAKRQVKQAGLANKIAVRKGDGLEVVQENEVDCITIAGMGGPLIVKILDQGKQKLTYVKRLILQPNIHAAAIRFWLAENGWVLIAEEILEEDHKIYEILVAEKGTAVMSEADMLFGPFLRREKSAAFQKKWCREKQKWEMILKELEKTEETAALLHKKQKLRKKIAFVREILHE